MLFLENMLKSIPGFKYYLENKRKRNIIYMQQSCSKKKFLTKWESNFIQCLDGKKVLTDRQFKKLEEIYKKSEQPRVRRYRKHIAEEIDSRFCDKYGVSWDEIHDFDKD